MNDTIRIEHIRGTTRVVQATKKITVSRFTGTYGCVIRRDEEHRGPIEESVDKRGRQKTIWKYASHIDLKSTGVRAGKEKDRAMWKRKIISHTGDPTW